MNALRRWRPLALSLGKASRQERNPGRGAVLGFFIGVLICCAIGNVIWLGRHWLTLPPPWDQAFYLYMGLRYLHALVDYGPVAGFREFIHLSTDVAPLYPLTTVPFYLVVWSLPPGGLPDEHWLSRPAAVGDLSAGGPPLWSPRWSSSSVHHRQHSRRR